MNRLIIKQKIAKALDRVGILDALRLLTHPVGTIRVVNFHGVPHSESAKFADLIDYLNSVYRIIGFEEFVKYANGCLDLNNERGILLTFDDGLRSDIEVVAPVLERLGLSACFFVPYGFVVTDEAMQQQYASSNMILHMDARDRIALNIWEIKQLASKHEIGCHTYSHARLGDEFPILELDKEIRISKQRLEEVVGRPLRCFAWVGGEESSYSREAAQFIIRCGFEFSYMTNNQIWAPASDRFAIQRTNLEANWEMSTIKFQLSGILDFWYFGKRWRLKSRLRPIEA